MPVTLVDSNILLDLITEDPVWSDWSATALERAADDGDLAINPIILAEVSVRVARYEDVESMIPSGVYNRRPLPWEAAFLAGKCFDRYRKRGGTRRSPLPDFYIGAHAVTEQMVLLTRDRARYQEYFPGLKIVAPPARNK